MAEKVKIDIRAEGYSEAEQKLKSLTMYSDEVVEAYFKGRRDVEEQAAGIIKSLQSELKWYRMKLARCQHEAGKKAKRGGGN